MPDTATTSGTSQPVQIGSYRLVEPLGSGGMSSVFRAEHIESGQEFALKILTRPLAKNSTLLQRFLREAKSAESLEHPNIVAIYDRGSEAGRYYLVLEYVPGGDLHDRVRSQGPLPVVDAVRVIRGGAEGLRYAAARGLIHRDIKPANILLTREGEAKLADLGLALHLEDEDERVTRDGTTVGTVDYMSPEQARDSRATSSRSDIYSLGCTFYHLLAGTAPFSGGDVPDKLRRHAQEAPPDVRKVRPDVPEAVAKLIRRMMAKKPEGRFADYDELIAALDALPPLPTGDAADPLFALFDDDADAPLPVPGGGPLLSITPVPSGPTVDLAAPPAPRPPSRPAPNVDLIELAALDDEPPPRARPAVATPVATPAARPAPVPTPTKPATHPTALFDDEDDPAGPPDDDDEDDAYGGAGFGTSRRNAYDDDALRQWIVRGLLIGAAVVLVAIGVDQLWRLQRSYSGGLQIPAAGNEAPGEAADAPADAREPAPAPVPAAPGNQAF
jgi:serine/threonine-protein kinase